MSRSAAGLIVALLATVGLASCGEATADWPQPSPAVWEVTGSGGQKGWLFGTIHALPDDAEWYTPQLDTVLDQTGVPVVEIAELNDTEARQRAFAAASSSPGLPALSRRVPADQRNALAAALSRADKTEAEFAAMETWAAALVLANAHRPNEGGNGVDRALLARGLPVEALEGFAEQFAIFDRLAEQDQAVLLYEAACHSGRNNEFALTKAWLTGDLAALEREEQEGLLADPELRQALLTGRNHAWTARIERLIGQRRRPLVAVGAAHMLGPEGLPALLAARGYAVRRIQ